MSTNARWIIGLLIAVIIGLGVGLAIVAGDSGEDDSVTLETETEETESSQNPTESTAPATPSDGGVSPPTVTKPDATGGLGAE